MKSLYLEKNTSASESQSTDKSKPKLSFYKDLEDMEQSRIQYNLNTDVLTRIKNTVELIKRIYGYKENLNNANNRKLFFK